MFQNHTRSVNQFFKLWFWGNFTKNYSNYKNLNTSHYDEITLYRSILTSKSPYIVLQFRRCEFTPHCNYVVVSLISLYNYLPLHRCDLTQFCNYAVITLCRFTITPFSQYTVFLLPRYLLILISFYTNSNLYRRKFRRKVQSV